MVRNLLRCRLDLGFRGFRGTSVDWKVGLADLNL